MSKRILSVLVCFVLIVQGFSVNTTCIKGDTGSTDTSVLDLVDKSVNSNNQFSVLKMKANMLKDGNVSIKYNMTLNSTYLNKYRNEIEQKVTDNVLSKPGFPVQEPGQSDESYQTAVHEYNDTYYQGLDDSILPQISVTLTYDKNIYEVPDKDKHIVLEFINDKGIKEKAGDCDFSEDANGNIVLTCKFSKIVYNRSNVVVSFSLDYLLKMELSAGESLAPIWVPSKEIISGQPKVEDEGYVAIDAAYSLKKSAPASVITPYIDYTIVAKVDDGQLNGKTVVDEIPDGMYVESVSVGAKKLTEEEYSIAGKELRYTFPKLAYDSSNLTKAATLKVRMYLTEDNYKKLMKENKFEQNFINNSYLKNLTTNERLTQVATTTTNMKLVYLEKEGSQEDLFGQRFKWFIRINSYFTHEVNAYAVDTINASAHTYDAITGVEVLKNGIAQEIIKPVEVTSTIPYENLTVSDLNTLTTDPGNPSNKRAVYYTYTDSEAKKRSVMIIPYNRFLNDRYNLNYYSDIVVPDGEGAQYVSGEKISNKVKLMWEPITIGDGTGINQDFQLELEKILQAKADIVKKSYSKYNPASNQITWLLDVNKMNATGGNFDEVQISDSMDQTIQKFPDDILNQVVPIQAKYKKAGSTVDIEIPCEANKVAGKPYYCVNNGPGSNDKTIVFKLGNLDSDEAYLITLNTIITKKEFFMNSNTITFSNMARSTALNNGVLCGNDSRDYAPLSNKLINQYALKQKFTNLAGTDRETSYDYKNHTTKWRTVVNEDAVLLKKTKLSEDLPEGASFDRFSAITIYQPTGAVLYTITSDDGEHFSLDGGATFLPSSGTKNNMTIDLPNGKKVKWNETERTVTPDGKDFTIPQNTIDLDFGEDLNYKLIYEFYTKYDATYRKEFLDNKTLSEETICTANLTAEYNGEVMGPVSRKASHIINPLIIEKSGWYNRSEGSITWSIFVNQDAVSLDGFNVADTLKQAFELNSKSIEISTYEVTPLGERDNYVDVTADFIGMINVSGSHNLEVKIPSAYKDIPIRIQFDTEISEDISVEEATNRVYLNEGNVQFRRTDDVRPSNMEAFTMEQFIELSPLAALFIDKVSNNGVALSGAEFKLTAMKNTGSGWNEDTERYSKVRTSKENGDIVFFNIERDRLYKLEELKAPNGYKKGCDVEYFIFMNDSSADSGYPDNTTKIATGEKRCNKTYENESKGNFIFRKLDTDENKLSGAKFSLVRNDDPTIKMDATSDSNGLVAFAKVDAGEYTLKEISAPHGYFPVEDTKVTIDVDEEETWSFNIESKPFVEKDSYGAYVIKDEIDALASPLPSVEPSEEPSVAPSIEPSGMPSTEPSITPTETSSSGSGGVTFAPGDIGNTYGPSVEPTQIVKPTEIVKPTSIPEPSMIATKKPARSPKPTKQPKPVKSPKPSKNNANTNSSSNGSNNGNQSSNRNDVKNKNGGNNGNNGNNGSGYYNENGQQGDRNSSISRENGKNTSGNGVPGNDSGNNIPRTGDSSVGTIMYILLGVLSLGGVIFFGRKVFVKNQ